METIPVPFGTTLRIPLGYDWHAHVRQNFPRDRRLDAVVRDHAAQFAGAIIMPNTKPHVTTVAQVLAYRKAILAAPRDHAYLPLMTVSLTPSMTRNDLMSCLACEHVVAVKFYAGTTTNADGIDNITLFGWAFELIERSGKPLLVHGEAAHPVEIMDRERRFWGTSGVYLVEKFPGLKISAEHISTAYLVDFVKNAREGVVGTITGHHLHTTLTDVLGQGICPDRMCMPVPKTEADKKALRGAVISGNPKFFLGTDSAPHPMFGDPDNSKYSARGCSGAYTGPQGVALYVPVFEEMDALDKLPGFASQFGCDFYGIPVPKGKVLLTKMEGDLPSSYRFGKGRVAPYRYRDDGKVFWHSERV